MSFVGIVCGLKSEAMTARAALSRLAGSDGRWRLGVSGADAARAEAIARAFCADGAAAILSVGLSGGLDPGLAPGALIATSVVRAAEGGIGAPPAALGPAGATEDQGAPILMAAPVYGSDVIIRSPDQKAALFAQTGAVAVDMESHGAARAALAARLPFLAIRAVADPAARALPGAALGAVAPDGSTRVLATLLKCVRAPADFPALLQLGRESEIGLKSLGGGLGRLFPRLLLGLDL